MTDGTWNSTTTPIVMPAEAVGSVGALMAVINQQLSNQFVRPLKSTLKATV